MDFLINEKIAALRKRQGKSMSEMSSLLGMAIGTYKRIESGAQSPRLQQLRDIAHVLGADLAVDITVSPTLVDNMEEK